MRSPVVCSLLLILLLPTSNALACATCLCGDPTLTTMGSEKPFAGRLRASVEYLTRSEITGDPQTSEHKIEEQRYTFSISYALNEHWIFAASLLPLPNVYEESRDVVDLSIRVPLRRGIAAKLDTKNVLNSPYEVTQGTVQREFYRTGRSFSFGFSWGN